MNLNNISLPNLVIQLLNGLSFSMLLFLLAAGLSVIFGILNVINLAHGGFYLLGSYFGYSLLNWSGNFWLALLVAPLLVGLVGFTLERGLLRRIYAGEHLNQIILTFGFAYILSDGMRWIWGGDAKSLPAPIPFNGTLELLGRQFPVYRLFVLVVGLALAGVLWYLLERTRLGAVLRAGVSDPEMARGLGINVSLLFTLVVAFGTGLAGLSGVIAGAYQSFGPPGNEFETLILALIVVVIGGLGTFSGAFWGAIVLGLTDSLGKLIFPDYAQFIIYAVMVAVLLVRPEGLFSRASNWKTS